MMQIVIGATTNNSFLVVEAFNIQNPRLGTAATLKKNSNNNNNNVFNKRLATTSTTTSTTSTTTTSSSSSSFSSSTALYNSKIPTLENWKVTRNGGITGYVANHPTLDDGDLITTSPLANPDSSAANEGKIVMTESGSKYRLGSSLANNGFFQRFSNNNGSSNSGNNNSGGNNNNNNNNNNNGVVITDSRTEANKKELSLTTIGGGKYVLAAGKPRRSTSGRSQIYNGYKLNGKSEPEGELLTIKVRSKDEGAIREGQNYKKVASGLGSILGPGQCFIARLDVLDDVNLGFASSINAISSPFGSSSTGGSRRQQKTQSGISSGDQFAIIMESGMMDLKGLLETRRFKGLEGRAMRDVASTAAQCIQAMHLSKMVWTDLKAENLVLMREDEFEPVTDGENGPVLVKGIDLESAMPFKDNPVDYSPESCPPEFAADYMKGVGAYFILEPSYDIWSLGMLLYECSTGKGYFNGKSPMQMTKALRNPNFFPRVEKVKDEKLRDLISQCLKKDPADRPSITKVLVHPYFLTTGIGPISF
eukprot:CAMPEP_0118685568 /NCGR_PEP_ID=MMETSP0800-20121206/7321_1 /TAXON_ID=210618 ORGANISM="Striatella unipunctata, Strain CCMP2910" /NCGR_SAMPLE_ID=MMETSP0800 /ASSEMBLY_ACC=CAM_ASM_000638 /LENGTH=533 /DNA_ID=CAMNT_0006582499 /DNA_START=205 /DNA_END=1806 /DNA_ORIENTATION=-